MTQGEYMKSELLLLLILFVGLGVFIENWILSAQVVFWMGITAWAFVEFDKEISIKPKEGA